MCIRHTSDLTRSPFFVGLSPFSFFVHATNYSLTLAFPATRFVIGRHHTTSSLEQFHWVQEQLSLRKVTVQEFARLGFEYTVMSKRKLAKLVEMGEVAGWDDPRFPTVQGALRRGVLVESLRQFILAQGFSRRIVTMEWDKFWSQNAKMMDKTASRYMALGADSAVPLVLVNFPSEEEGAGLRVQLHPKDPSLGYKAMTTGSQLLVEREDAAQVS